MGGTDEFGARLRAHRYAAGLSQQELADRSGLSAKTIGNLERGRARWPHPNSVLRLADALGLTGPEWDEFTAAPDRRLARPDEPAVPRQVQREDREQDDPARDDPARDDPARDDLARNDPARDDLPREDSERRVREAGASAGATAAGAAAGYRHALPPDTAAFTGRDAELELITEAVTNGAAPGGVVAIRAIGGMPGVGKTALAVHAAHLLTGSFPDRQLFVNLHGHTPDRDPVSPEDALAGLLAATGVDPRFLPAELSGRAMLWRDRTAGQRAVLVLDNAASSAQVEPLLPGGGCLVLVTSRRHLADLPGLVVPVPVDTLPPGHARAMFIRLAPRAAAEQPDRIGELAGLAGHLPLAVTLLARVYARHPSWTLADLIAETRGSLLTLAAEHASVAAAFDVSWRHLDPGRQSFLARLGLHPGSSIDGHAAAALAGCPVAEAARLLDDLHGEGLLTETGYRRYQMHDLIHAYAAAQADAVMTTGERDQAVVRLLDYCTHAAARANALLSRQPRNIPGLTPATAELPDAELPDAGRPDAALADTELPDLSTSTDALAWARTERANLIACLDQATATGAGATVITLTAAVAELLRRDGPWTEATARHGAAAEAARRLGDRPGLARSLLNLGTLRRLAGDYEGAADALTEAADLHRDLGDGPGLADVFLEQALVRGLIDEYQASAELAEAALASYRDTGGRLGQADALIALASARRRTDEYQAAASALIQALEICRDLGDRKGEAWALCQLGDVRRLTGDYQAAARDLEQSARLYRDLDDRTGQASALTWLGGVRRLTGDYQAAARDLERALAIHADLDNRLGQANSLIWLGDVREATGDHQAAARDLEQALAIFRDLGSLAGQANALSWLGNLRRVTGDYLAAAGHLAEALALSRDLGDRGGEATGLNNIGALHFAQDEIARARACHEQALDLARQIASPWDEAHALAGLGRCARADGHAPAAARLLREAYQIFHRTGSGEAATVATEIDSITGLAQY